MALNYKIGAGVMMQLGGFQFGINTAAYQSLKRSTEYRWPTQDRFGLGPVSQFVGQGAETISLPGVVYTEWRGGLRQIAAMRAAAEKGEPLLMVDGRGNMMGRWVIDRVEEEQSVFADAGVARRQDFTLQLHRYFETDPALEALYTAQAQPIPEVAGQPVPAVPAAAKTPVDKVRGLADSVTTSAKSLTGAISQAYDQVLQSVSPITSVASDALGAVRRSAEVANDLLFVANRVRAVLGKSPVNATAISAARSMAGKAGSVLTGAESAGRLLRNTTRKLEGMTGVSPSAVQACRNAAGVAERTANVCRQTASEANKITG